MPNETQDWRAVWEERQRRWAAAVDASQQLPEALVVGKVFELCVADGKVLYQVTRLRARDCYVELFDGGPDNYQDAVLGEGGWFPRRAIEPLVLRHHRLTALFRQH